MIELSSFELACDHSILKDVDYRIRAQGFSTVITEYETEATIEVGVNTLEDLALLSATLLGLLANYGGD